MCEIDKSDSPSDGDELSVDEWRQEFGVMLQNPPVEGDLLRARGDEKVRLSFALEPGKIPFIYARLYLLTKVGIRPQWYAEGDKTFVSHYTGKVILAPRARDSVIVKFGLNHQFVVCTELEILRTSISQKSWIAEISQW